jgi:ABC-type cobalamin transport system permease subunit
MSRLRKRFTAIGWAVLVAGGMCWAQNAPPAPNLESAPVSAAPTTAGISWTQIQLFLMPNFVLLFGLIVAGMQFLYLRKSRHNVDNPLHFFVTTLVIVGAVFIYVMSGSEQALSGAFGIFGTIIGYLLGKRSSTEQSNSPGVASNGATASTPTAGQGNRVP